MTDEHRGRWEEGPRVRVRPRGGPDAASMGRAPVGQAPAGRAPEAPPLDPIGGALRDLERRFLDTLPTSAQAAPAELQATYLTILSELREIDADIQESIGRHDLPYVIDRRLATLADHCEWMTKRVTGELMLLVQVAVERDLKRMISSQAYQLFLRLEEIEAVARDFDDLSGKALMERLREGTLFREILEQVRLGSGASVPAPPGDHNGE